MGKCGDKTRAKILKTFNDLAYTQSYKKTTIRQVGQQLGISNGNIYFYFHKKEEIVEALNSDLFAKLRIIFTEINFTGDNDLLDYMMQYYIMFYLTDRVQPLRNCAAEVLDSSELFLTFVRHRERPLTAILKKGQILSEEEINEPTILLSVTSAMASYYAVFKLSAEEQAHYSVSTLFTLYFQILFSVLKIDGNSYIEQAHEKFAQLDKDYIVQRVYELQDYDYENTIDD